MIDSVNNPFQVLPQEVLNLIFSHIPDEDLALKISLVCKQLMVATSDEKIWKERIFSLINKNEAKAKIFFKFNYTNWKLVYFSVKQLHQVGKFVPMIGASAYNTEPTKVGKTDKKGNFNGIILYPDGEIWRGAFNKEDKLNGQGLILFATGEMRMGKFKKDELQKGRISRAHGIEEQGEFRKNKLHGKGKQMIHTGDVQEICEGTFKDGDLVKSNKGNSSRR